MNNGSCICSSCGWKFRSLSSFDMHRTGSYASTLWEPARRRCLSVAEMERKGMRLNEHDAWTTGIEFAKKMAA
jgi:hypothetical protein